MDALLVKPRHPLGGLYFEVVQSLPVAPDAGEHGGVAKQLGLEEREHGLGHRIIKRIADSADRGRDAQLLEALGVGQGDVLTARVRVARQLVEREKASCPGRHVERVDHEFFGHRTSRLPSDDASAEDVGDKSHVDNAGPRGAVGKIGHP